MTHMISNAVRGTRGNSQTGNGRSGAANEHDNR